MIYRIFRSCYHCHPLAARPQKTAPAAAPTYTGWLPPTCAASCCQSGTHRATLGRRRVGAAAVFGGWGMRWGQGGRGGSFSELAELAELSGSKVVKPVIPVFMPTTFAAFTGFLAGVPGGVGRSGYCVKYCTIFHCTKEWRVCHDHIEN